MKLTPKDVARAYYLATRQASQKDAARIAANLIEAARDRGFERTLHEALAALPAAMEEVDAESRVIVEGEREIDEETAEAALAAAGIATENVDVVRRASPGLVGGIRIRTKDAVIDATVRRMLDDLARAARKAPERTES